MYVRSYVRTLRRYAPIRTYVIQATEEILQVFLSYSLLVLESVDTQIYVHVHDHVRSYRADNESIWGSF